MQVVMVSASLRQGINIVSFSGGDIKSSWYLFILDNMAADPSTCQYRNYLVVKFYRLLTLEHKQVVQPQLELLPGKQRKTFIVEDCRRSADRR